MRKLMWEEAVLFLVPLGIVPLCLMLAQLRPPPAPQPPPLATAQPEPRPTSAPEPTLAKPTPIPRLSPEAVSIVASRDGRLLYTFAAQGSGGIQAWDARTRLLKRSYDGLAGPSTTLRLSPDGGTMYYQAWQRNHGGPPTGALIDLSSGKQHLFTARPQQDISHVGLGHRVLASASDNSIELRSLRDGHVTGAIRAEREGFTPELPCSSPDGSLLAWIANRKAPDDRRRLNPTSGDRMEIYDLNRARRVFSQALGGHNIREVAISGDNARLIALADYFPGDPRFSISNEDRKLLIFDARSGRLQHKVSLGMGRMGEGRGVGLQPSPDGRWVAFESGDYFHLCDVDFVQVVSLASGRSQVLAQKHTQPAIAFGSDSREVFIMLSRRRLQLTPGDTWKDVDF